MIGTDRCIAGRAALYCFISRSGTPSATDTLLCSSSNRCSMASWCRWHLLNDACCSRLASFHCFSQHIPPKTFQKNTFAAGLSSVVCRIACHKNNISIVGTNIKQVLEQDHRPPPRLPLSRVSADQLVKTVYRSFCLVVVENYFCFFVTSFIVYFGIMMLPIDAY